LEVLLRDEHGATESAVWYLLLQGEGLFNQGFIVVTDNYYTRYHLVMELLENGVYYLGTVKV
jgi:hypothetical protein